MVNDRFHQFSPSGIHSNEKGYKPEQDSVANKLDLFGNAVYGFIEWLDSVHSAGTAEEVSHEFRFGLHLMRGSRSHQIISAHHEPSIRSSRARDLYSLLPRPWPRQPVEKFRQQRL